MFDRNLNEKLSLGLNGMYRLSKDLMVENLSIVFNTLISSSLPYGANVWHFCSKRNSYKIGKIQERGLRLVYKDYNCSYNEFLEKSEEKCTMYVNRITSMAVCVYEILNIELKPMSDVFL